MHKLISYDIKDNIFRLIKDLYSKSNCAIKLGQYRTKIFKYSRGVRQGCILSPLLFNHYSNELPFSLNKTETSDSFILPDGTKLNSLLYADDLIILSRSKHGLQNCLNTLNHFCKSWKLDVNLKKTKVMIFQNKTRKLQNQNFYLDDRLVETTQEYTYLGVKLTSTGNFTAAKKQLSEKGLYALFGIRKYSNINRFPPQSWVFLLRQGQNWYLLVLLVICTSFCINNQFSSVHSNDYNFVSQHDRPIKSTKNRDARTAKKAKPRKKKVQQVILITSCLPYVYAFCSFDSVRLNSFTVTSR